jgi:trimeric autotransporter adhesin
VVFRRRNKMKTIRISSLFYFVLLVLSGSAYGGTNVVIGDGAGFECDTCDCDVFIGWDAGASDRATSYNTYVGEKTAQGYGSTFLGGPYSTGSENTFIGAWAGLFVYDGSKNTLVGKESGFNNDSGWHNTYLGYHAGYGGTRPITSSNNTYVGDDAGHYTTTGSNNTALGHAAGLSNSDGNHNVFIGDSTGYYTHGSYNTFMGVNAGYNNVTGIGNVFLGSGAGASELGSNKLYIDNCYLVDGASNCTFPLIYGEFDTRKVVIDGSIEVRGGGAIVANGNVTSFGKDTGAVGYYETFIGTGAGSSTSTGERNSFVGYNAGNTNTSGDGNSFFGSGAGSDNRTGSWNTYIGVGTAANHMSGSSNTFVGWGAGSCVPPWTGGSGNVFLGYQAGCSETGANKLYIDNCVYGGGCTNPLIYGQFNNPRLVQINGQLIMSSGSSLSDRRLKKNIEPLKSSLGKVMHLQGVSYEWREEENAGRGFNKDRQIGLIAQDVEAVIPELIHTDSEGYKALAYDKVVPVLIEAIKEQQGMISDLKKVNSEKESRIVKLENALAEVEQRLTAVEMPVGTVVLKQEVLRR